MVYGIEFIIRKSAIIAVLDVGEVKFPLKEWTIKFD